MTSAFGSVTSPRWFGASAQNYPEKPITIVVAVRRGWPDRQGGPRSGRSDPQPLGGQVIIENVAGAAARWVTTKVAKAGADGYTFKLLAHVAMAHAPALYRKLQYDARSTTFEYLGLVNEVPMT